MDFTIWAGVGLAAAVLIPLAMYLLPARTKIVLDTPTSTARAEMRLLWGLGPPIIARALPKQGNGSPLAFFNDAVRIGHALMTPRIADEAIAVVRELYAHEPRVAQMRFGLNLGDPSKNLVVQTAAQAALAAVPAALRQRIEIYKCDAPGAELHGQFELDASPAKLNGIYGQFKSSRAVREFRKRLSKKSKPEKKGPSQVRVG